MATDSNRLQAVQMLVLANACWALSFPTMRALALWHQSLYPAENSWFIATFTLAIRFATATAVMLLICCRTLRRLTRLEIWEGVGLGLFASAGLIFQMDGLAYTSASTSAFLTQFYCLLIPLAVAWRARRWPSPVVWASCLMVIAGVGMLSGIDWRELRMGRGESETLIGSTIFTGQILWLQRREFVGNNVNHFTLIMFAVVAFTTLPIALITGSGSSGGIDAYASVPALVFLAILTGLCTLGGYCVMNYWQPFLSAVQAGLLYCLEPVFASLFALFLPAWFSALAGIDYANERVSFNLLVGGGLITIANVFIQLRPI